MSPQKVNSFNLPAGLHDFRTASTTSGGTALTTTATGTGTPTALGIVPIPFGSDYMSITARAFSSAAVVRFSLNPYLTIFHTQDAGVTVTDIGDEAQDGDATDINLDSFAATGTGFLYVGAETPFRGVAVDIGTGAQGTSNTITVKYWQESAGGVWTDISATDSTDTGASFAVDATITWTVPTDWKLAPLSVIGDTLPSSAPSFNVPLYWTRWEWDNAFDSDTDIQQMLALNRSTDFAEIIEGQTVEISLQDRRVASVQAITNAGTANLIVNVGTFATGIDAARRGFEELT